MLTRRKFNALCTSLAGGAALLGDSSLAATTNQISDAALRMVKFRNGAVVPALGQGSWHLGQERHPAAVEEEAMRTGLSLGMSLIDTALVYGGGSSEQLIGRVIGGQRDRVFLVSKVPPARAKEDGDIARACAESLARLGTDYVDLYLLHWRDDIRDLSRVVASFEDLRSAGKIRAWGVSNFIVRDMEELFRVPHGNNCATNQILYNLGHRGIERDLLPWCQQRNMPVMAYSPLGGPGTDLLRSPTLARIGAALGCSAAAVALAWSIRSGNVIAVVESGSPTHVRENAAALSLKLRPQDLQILDKEYPGLH